MGGEGERTKGKGSPCSPPSPSPFVPAKQAMKGYKLEASQARHDSIRRRLTARNFQLFHFLGY